jgi:hypothetical protein
MPEAFLGRLPVCTPSRRFPSEKRKVHQIALILVQMDKPIEPVLHIVSADVQSGRKPYHRHYDLGQQTPSVYRMHSFETKKDRIIRGFTSDICIAVARTAYAREPEFERKAPAQQPRKYHIVHARRSAHVEICLPDAQWTSPGAAGLSGRGAQKGDKGTGGQAVGGLGGRTGSRQVHCTIVRLHDALARLQEVLHALKACQLCMRRVLLTYSQLDR